MRTSGAKTSGQQERKLTRGSTSRINPAKLLEHVPASTGNSIIRGHSLVDNFGLLTFLLIVSQIFALQLVLNTDCNSVGVVAYVAANGIKQDGRDGHYAEHMQQQDYREAPSFDDVWPSQDNGASELAGEQLWVAKGGKAVPDKDRRAPETAADAEVAPHPDEGWGGSGQSGSGANNGHNGFRRRRRHHHRRLGYSHGHSHSGRRSRGLNSDWIDGAALEELGPESELASESGVGRRQRRNRKLGAEQLLNDNVSSSTPSSSARSLVEAQSGAKELGADEPLEPKTNPLIEFARSTELGANNVEEDDDEESSNDDSGSNGDQDDDDDDDDDESGKRPQDKATPAIQDSLDGYKEHRDVSAAPARGAPIQKGPNEPHHNGRNIRGQPLAGAGNRGAKSARFWHKNRRWCHEDCNSINSGVADSDSGIASVSGTPAVATRLGPSAQASTTTDGATNGLPYREQPSGPICASDGRLYGSECELKRHSCRHNVHLFRKPQIYCLQMAQTRSRNAEGKGNSSSSDPAASSSSYSRRAQIVELRQQCDKAQLNNLKRLLLHKFRVDVDAIFRYFDSNGDDYIEAHELWPRQNNSSEHGDSTPLANERLVYAQIMNEHVDHCPVHHHDQRRWLATKYNKYRKTNLDEQAGTSKCWFFLDFVFEPYFKTNPCSLSHLMIFDLVHPYTKFTRELFQQAFDGLLGHKQDNDLRADNSTLEDDLTRPIRYFEKVLLGVGESRILSCLDDLPRNFWFTLIKINENEILDDEISAMTSKLSQDSDCAWTRNNVNLASIRDPHISIEDARSRNVDSKKSMPSYDSTSNGESLSNPVMHIKDVQLYLSGQYQCKCSLKRVERTFERTFAVQVLAKPQIRIRPHSQWTLPGSKVSFECSYDYIDTSYDLSSTTTQQQLHKDDDKLLFDDKDSKVKSSTNSIPIKFHGQFGRDIKWFKDNQEIVIERENESKSNDAYPDDDGSANNVGSNKQSIAPSAGHTVRVMRTTNTTNNNDNDNDNEDDNSSFHWPSDGLSGLRNSDTDNYGYSNEDVNRDRESIALMDQMSSRASVTMAASIFSLENVVSNDTGKYTCMLDGSQSEHEAINKMSNQDHGSLLVGDKPKSPDQSNEENQAQLWIFHDNGISIYRLQNDDSQEMELLREINGHSPVNSEVDGNWNQLTLCGGLNPEQVVICEWSDNALYIDTNRDDEERTPIAKPARYVYVGQPNLNRVIVIESRSFEIVAIINTEPQPRKLYHFKPTKIHLTKWVRRRMSPTANARWLDSINREQFSNSELNGQKSTSIESAALERRRRDNRKSPPALVQHDIWLLCYGQPLVLDPSGEDHSQDNNSEFISRPEMWSNVQRSNQKRSLQLLTPFLSTRPFAWSAWSSKESKLRNRKSVHIIQSTFLKHKSPLSSDIHNHLDMEANSSNSDNKPLSLNASVIRNFKRSAVITTHHVFPGIPSARNIPKYLNNIQVDLIHDLYVPTKPPSLVKDRRYKVHYAYVTHYDESRLFRVSMDEYRYDREVDLPNCDPVNMLSTAQGLVIIQCRAPITHNLVGQLVLDQLTSSRVNFDPDIRAQEMYLSPDNRFLVSIFTNLVTVTEPLSSDNAKAEQRQQQQERQSTIYVQIVQVSGLKLQYKIKTTLDISQCSFVWKDGYYAAIFVSTSSKTQQSEILSLRLVDSRLELIARVPGVMSSSRHRDQLSISPELRLAALSTNQGTFIVDLEENRVAQTLHHHQSQLTLLWM